MTLYDSFAGHSEADITSLVREDLPRIPKNRVRSNYEEWAWSFVCTAKDCIAKQKEYGVAVWPAENVKAAFMEELFSVGLDLDDRKNLVIEYNRTYGGSRFPKDWPDTIAYTIDSIDDDLGGLPPLNPKVFKPSPKPSPYFPKLLLAVYMAGTFDQKFIFGLKPFASRFGCSKKTLHKFMHKLVKLGYVRIVRSGSFGYRECRRCTLYSLTDRETLLDLFEFPNEGDRERVLRSINSVERQIDKNDWGKYIITYDWLKMNRLLSRFSKGKER